MERARAKSYHPGIKNILITGPPGSGKTTLVRSLRLPGARGFTTAEIRERGRRVGFAVETLSGLRGILARAGEPRPHRVGRYGVRLEEFESIACRELEEAIGTPWIVIDEIGGMELLSDRFRAAVVAALDSPSRVLAAIMEKDDPFTRAIKRRPDVAVVPVGEADRVNELVG